ncbi:MAG: hypothetical protein R2806_20215 [Saprospiraceae bacterium]
MKHVIFITPFFTENAKQFLAGLSRLRSRIRLSVISQDAEEHLPEDIRLGIGRFWKVKDIQSYQEMLEACKSLRDEIGPINRCLVVNEQVQELVASIRESLDIPGMRPATARNYRNKKRMKEVLEKSQVPIAKNYKVLNQDDAQKAIKKIGLPLVAKPIRGAAAQETFRILDESAWQRFLDRHVGESKGPWLLEQMLSGQEYSCDTFCLNGKMLFRTYNQYIPSPLEVIENDWIQWQVILPNPTGGPDFEDIRKLADKTLKALGAEDGWSHLEWFRLNDGSIAVSEAAMRPPGAQFTTMVSRAADFDSIEAWATLMIDGEFQIPKQKYAVGTAYLRGMGEGTVSGIHGWEAIQQQYASLICDHRIPAIGTPKSQTYEGEGFVIVRHPDTELVRSVLLDIVSTVRVFLSK